ncbi:SDR family NAD(P)-dependent oxidoreductase [Chelativorans intermedius]|uniref:SDR family NAD(P)-dependent oxidoreductase n=1 Tax=Chelativorans intermedius TaxID=515947 RepID=A0ABV6D6B5_9HYPH|nr:SDR family oxidoreductase [Chelativorans intermedius]MCT8999434.1 SDR family oxidoreductase [Chelativorans intermedius]
MDRWQERFSIAGRKALISGGTKGIGAEIVRVFLDAGADVAAIGRDSAGFAAGREAAAAAGRDFIGIEADLATAEGPVEAANRALAHFGRIDILVNSAGVALVDPLLEASVEDWDRTMAVNLRAPFLLARTVAPGMIERRAGKIVNISSQTGVIALPDHAAYASSKAALNALTKSMTVEWARYNIQINAICPTVVMTPMGRKLWSPPEKRDPMLARTPAGRFGEPVEIADCALYLASPASDLMNGAIVMLEGGYTSL